MMAALGCVVECKSKEELAAGRSKFLVDLENVHGYTAIRDVAVYLNKVLDMPEDAPAGAWIKFATEKAAFNANRQGWEDLDKENIPFVEKAKKLIDQFLPPIGSEDELKMEEANQKDKFYGTMIPYMVQAYFRAVDKQVIRNLHARMQAKLTGDVNKVDLYPNESDNVFVLGMFARLQEYIRKFANKLKAGSQEKVNYINEGNKLLVAAKESFEFHSDSFKDTLKEYQAVSQFYTNLLFSLIQEHAYMGALLKEGAIAADAPFIQDLTDLVTLEIKLVAAGINQEWTVDTLLQNWESEYVDETAEADQASLNQAQLYRSIGTLYATIAEVVGSEISLSKRAEFVHDLVRFRIKTHTSMGSSFVRKATLGPLPMPADHEAWENEAQKAWNYISEVASPADPTYQTWLNENAHSFLEFILAVDTPTIQTLNICRGYFQTTLLPATHKDFFQELFEVVLSFAMSVEHAPKENPTQWFDDFLESKYAGQDNYILFKIHNINMLNAPAFLLNFDGSSNAAIDATVDAFAKKDFSLYKQAFTKAFNAFFPEQTIENDLELVTKVVEHATKAGTVSSSNFQIVTWHKKLAI